MVALHRAGGLLDRRFRVQAHEPERRSVPCPPGAFPVNVATTVTAPDCMPTRGRPRPLRRGRRALRAHRRALQQRRHSPPDDASILDTDLDACQRVQDVDLKGVFLCCKYGLPHLLAAGGGSVINMASFVAVMGATTFLVDGGISSAYTTPS